MRCRFREGSAFRLLPSAFRLPTSGPSTDRRQSRLNNWQKMTSLWSGWFSPWSHGSARPTGAIAPSADNLALQGGGLGSVFPELLEFKQKHGHLLIPSRDLEYKSLHWWAVRQRKSCLPAPYLPIVGNGCKPQNIRACHLSTFRRRRNGTRSGPAF